MTLQESLIIKDLQEKLLQRVFELIFLALFIVTLGYLGLGQENSAKLL